MPFASVVVVPSTPPLVFSRVTITFDTPGSPASWNPSLFVSSHTRSPNAAVATGVFGADMAVQLTNDGPFTVLLDVDSD